jgi:hypothetical protein
VSIRYICKVDVKIKLSKCNDIDMTTTTPTLGKEQVFLFGEGGRGWGFGQLSKRQKKILAT